MSTVLIRDPSPVTKLREQIALTEATLRHDRERLAQIEESCIHNRSADAWSAAQGSTETYKKEVVDVFAPMQGQGVDRWHGSRYVDAYRTLWTRTCLHCGKIEKTTETKDQVTQVPAFR